MRYGFDARCSPIHNIVLFHTLHNAGQGVILDRSVYSDCVFANVCRDEGYISADGELQRTLAPVL